MTDQLADTALPLSTFAHLLLLRHSGMRPFGRGPAIQHHALLWTPGSRQVARPGMTVYKKLCGSTSTSSLRLPLVFGPTASHSRRYSDRSTLRSDFTKSRKR